MDSCTYLLDGFGILLRSFWGIWLDFRNVLTVLPPWILGRKSILTKKYPNPHGPIRIWVFIEGLYTYWEHIRITWEFQRLLKSSSKIIRDLIKLQSVPAVAKFYLSGTGTNMSSHVEGKSMGKGSIAISVEKLPRPLMEWSSTWSELICCTPENLVGSSLLVLTQNVWWWSLS